MTTKPIVIQVPALETSLTEIFFSLGFGRGNGDGVAKSFEDPALRWKKDHIVWLCPVVPDAKLDCLHSLYGSTMAEQTAICDLFGAHGLFCLAAHLKQNNYPELQEFDGVVYAFGAAKLEKLTVLNHRDHIAFDIPDLSTPVLYIRQGRPMSIYTMWHTGFVEKQSLVGLCGSTTIFRLDEEIARLAA